MKRTTVIICIRINNLHITTIVLKRHHIILSPIAGNYQQTCWTAFSLGRTTTSLDMATRS